MTMPPAIWRWVRTTRFELKKTVFALILVAFVYGAVHLMCLVFVKVMSMRDERLKEHETTTLSDKARRGIQAMLDGTSYHVYDKDIGAAIK